MHSLPSSARFRLVPMGPRNPTEKSRTASTLELFFDLVFVVAVSTAAQNFHQLMSDGDIGGALAHYLMAFFGIWWAWMNFTWFGTSFDTDDWLYRLVTIVQMAGVLVLAAGLEPAFTESNYTVLVIGYVVMRVAMVFQWLRAARSGGQAGRAAMVYAAGILSVQVLWVAWLAVPASITQVLGFVLLMLVEVSVPVVAERIGSTPWHPHHITERYGLFTLIVLGESLSASANAIIEALHESEELGELVAIAILALVVTAGLWWIYFWPPHHRSISSFGASLRYGYVHYFVFAAAGAFSAGIELEIDNLSHQSQLPSLIASYSVAVPVAVFLMGIWWIAFRKHADGVVNTAVPLGALLVLLDPVLPLPVAVTALVVAAVVLVLVIRDPLADPTEDPSL
ncbi:low temperature requirement protein A [Rothia uropygialis]|uniref:low temperature requirement protein A n=1 Tax=Kocuria sp. 36 TaxID=1415402 RepID=UPI0019310798|nr:low temperature requirement protein A [Kocuria sp. 36]